MDPSKYLDGLKLSPKHLAGLAVATGVFLALRPEALAFFGLTGVNSAIRPWAAGALILSGSLLAVHGASGLTTLGKRWWDHRKVKKRREAALRDLSPMEKEVLGTYVIPDAKLVSLAAGSGVAERLVAEDILYRESSEWVGKTSRPYNIRPWAKEYLERYPALLEPDDLPPPTDPTGVTLDETAGNSDPEESHCRNTLNREEEIQRILDSIQEVHQRQVSDKKKETKPEEEESRTQLSRVGIWQRIRSAGLTMPSGIAEWIYASAFIFFDISMVLFSCSHFGSEFQRTVVVNVGMGAFLLSLLALGVYFLIDLGDLYKAVRDFPESQRDWIRRDLRLAEGVLGKLRVQDLSSLRVVKSYLDLALVNRRTRLAMVFGAIEKVGLLPAFSGAWLGWAKWLSESSAGWMWLTVALQLVTLVVVRFRHVIEQLELECWVAGEAVREKEEEERPGAKQRDEEAAEATVVGPVGPP